MNTPSKRGLPHTKSNARDEARHGKALEGFLKRYF